MTTPQFPYGSTDPSDLPQGVLAPSQFQTALQDQTTDKFQNLASSRFPGTAKTTSAGSPANVGGPMGFIVRLFSQIVSTAANADPATITKPEDLVDLTGGFFHGLPLLQTAIIEPLSHLLSWITGRPSEDFDTVDELKGAFFDWLDDIPFIGPLVQALQGLAVSGPLAFISGLMNIRWAQADATEVTATQAITAATAADNKITNLLNGGIRTVHTSDFVYVPPPNLTKLWVIIGGGGGSGTRAGGSNNSGGLGGTGGGYACYEFLPSQLPASVPCTVAAGRAGGSNNTSPAVSSFGSLAFSPSGNTSGIQDPRGFINADGSAPGDGGAGGMANSNYVAGSAGGSSLLAAGGGSGAAGANAPTTGQTLAGGGGGGGGASNRGVGGSGQAGGAGGFPGGGGGGGGSGYLSGWPGGPGAPAFMATVEFFS